MNNIQSISICKIATCASYILLLAFVISSSFSCSRKPGINKVSHAIIEYEREVYRGYKYIPVQINEDRDIGTIESAMAAKEIVSAIFPRKQYLTIMFTDGEKKVYALNDYVLRDSNHCYQIPEGELRERFVNLINTNQPPEDNTVTPADKLSVRHVHEAVIKEDAEK